jgi:hypothetical protein
VASRVLRIRSFLGVCDGVADCRAEELPGPGAEALDRKFDDGALPAIQLMLPELT